MVTIVHFINQFFAGFGGEEKADMPVGFIEGPKGPGTALSQVLAEQGRIIATIYAGDNFSHEHSEVFLNEALAHIRRLKPDVVVAGPAFNSGRYGMACGMLLKAVEDKLGIPGVTGLGPDNPGIDSFRKFCWIVPVGRSAAGMRAALPEMAKLALKLGRKEVLGPASPEGYLPRGFRLNVKVDKNAAVRAVDMALARLSGGTWETELKRVKFEEVPPPAPINDLSCATIAMVTEGGMVPVGNPDRLETRNATKWCHYPINGDDLQQGEYEVWHGGYISTWVNQDPDRNVPLDALRSLEKEKFIGELYGEYLVTTGNMTNVSTCQNLGREMGGYLKSRGVTGVILTAT